MEHICKKEAIIEELRKENQESKIKIKVLESNVDAVKENIKDMKGTIKEVSSKMDNMSKTNIAILVSVILLLLGVVVNFFVK